jgi:predicted DNA-binding protein with PD1-like motif
MSTYYPRLATIGIPCAVLVAVALATNARSETSPDEYAKSYSVGEHPDVHVRAGFGFVHVTTSDSNKVEFDVRYDKTDWASGLPIDSKQNGNVVELTALVDQRTWWGWGHWGNHRLDIDVRMPKNANLQVETSNGRIEVASLNGTISLHTSNGEIKADQLSGVVDLGSSNGALNVSALKGTLKARTSNGSIVATGLDGTCELATSNGKLQTDGRFESLNLSTGNGAIVARAESGSRMSSGWTIHTTNAAVDLTVPHDFKATLVAETSNASITLDLPVTVQKYESKGQQIRGALNGGGPELSVHTTNGAIRLKGT